MIEEWGVELLAAEGLEVVVEKSDRAKGVETINLESGWGDRRRDIADGRRSRRSSVKLKCSRIGPTSFCFKIC